MDGRHESKRGRGCWGRWLAAALAGLLLETPGAAASEGGLEIFPEPRMLLLLIVLFLLLVGPLQALLFRPLLRVLDERLERTQGARERAAQLRQEAERLDARHRRALHEVRQQADRERAERVDAVKRANGAEVTAARTAAESEVERARDEIRAAEERARGALRDEAEELGQIIAGRLLGRKLS